MEKTDVLVIGAGLLGCFAARALSMYKLNTAVIEKREDVCTGVSKANSGIIYTGYDTRPGTLKTQLCVKANRNFDQLCKDLDVEFSRCGSLMISFGPNADKTLEKKYAHGLENGVSDIELISRDKILEMEPLISPDVRGALYAKNTGTVMPFELCIAAFENAKDNGVNFYFNEEVIKIERSGSEFIVHATEKTFKTKAILNCAGLCADAVRDLCEAPLIKLRPTGADYMILDPAEGTYLDHVIFHEPEIKGKGLTLVPTVKGNLMVGPTERPDSGYLETETEGLEFLRKLCSEIVPSLPLPVIRSFASSRPNPFYADDSGRDGGKPGKSISEFTFLEEAGLFSLIGIKTPGLTCADELGKYAAEKICRYLGGAEKNKNFDPVRKGIRSVKKLSIDERNELIKADPDYGRLICHCEQISFAEAKEAIRRGASTVDGIKRRTGAGMGRCQESRCLKDKIALLSSELGKKPENITKDGITSEILK